MKTACYILTIYLLSLAGMPCADSMPGHSLKGDAVSLSISDNDGRHDHNSGGDDCSTLCGCQCCHIHVLVAPPLTLGPAESASTAYLNHIHHFTNTVISPFLRPPIA